MSTNTRRGLLWMGAVVLSAVFSLPALAGISATKHNLSTSGTGTNKLTAGTDQICVFCHTPHGSDTSAAVPLWNKKLPSTTYLTYDQLNTSSLDGGVLAVGSVSLACLSCHDGTQAMDNLINAPGSGGYNAAGASPTGWTWAGVSTLNADPTKLGSDLKNDHPIGIEYCGGGVTGSGTTVTASCADADFKKGATELYTASINSNQVFWVEVDGNATRGKGDIHLYTRDFTSKGGDANGPSVECGSCHDPHVEPGTNGISFMRVTTAGSQICLSCHVK